MCSSMDGPGECHSEYSQSDREGELLYDTPYMWNLKKIIQKHLQNRKRLTNLKNKLMVVGGKDWGRDS